MSNRVYIKISYERDTRKYRLEVVRFDAAEALPPGELAPLFRAIARAEEYEAEAAFRTARLCHAPARSVLENLFVIDASCVPSPGE